MTSSKKLVLFGLLLVAAVTCKVNSDSIYKHLHYCDATLTTESCGSTSEGAPMMCYAARQIGSRDFCTERCPADDATLTGEGWRCVDTKAKVETCRPSEDKPCQLPGTQCLNTDVLKDEGVCLPMDVCNVDADCRDPAHPTCAASGIRAWYGEKAVVHANHSFCEKLGCKQGLSSCGPGEVCLPTQIASGSNPPDMCVPICDANLNCPPNFFCFRKVSGPGAPAVCIPGMMGFRCLTDMDCLVGDCVDSGDGFKLCSALCETHDDCAKFGSTRGIFVCGKDSAGPGKHCINPTAFTGSPCRTSSDCRSHEECIIDSPYGWKMTEGECRARCGPGLPCVHRMGMPHACVETSGKSTCYPGRFGVQCQDDSECMGNLKCLDVADVNAKNEPEVRRFCSAPCQTDQDCTNNLHVEKWGFCNNGICALQRLEGRQCERSAQCHELTCAASPLPEDQAAGTLRCRK